MDNNSKIPSWLQDRKKLIILVIVIFAIIVSSFTTVNTASAIIKKVKSGGIFATNKIGQLFASKKLDGTYQNLYVEETMTFSKDGSVIYSYGGTLIFGTYEINGKYLELELEGNEYEFEIKENSGKNLTLDYMGFEYNYQKQ